MFFVGRQCSETVARPSHTRPGSTEVLEIALCRGFPRLGEREGDAVPLAFRISGWCGKQEGQDIQFTRLTRGGEAELAVSFCKVEIDDCAIFHN